MLPNLDTNFVESIFLYCLLSESSNSITVYIIFTYRNIINYFFWASIFENSLRQGILEQFMLCIPLSQ